MGVLLQAPPVVPDKGTLELLIGPYGALMLLAILVSVLGWLVWRLINRSDAKDDAINALHKEYAEKLLVLQKENAASLTAMVKEGQRLDSEGIAATRELAATVRAATKAT